VVVSFFMMFFIISCLFHTIILLKYYFAVIVSFFSLLSIISFFISLSIIRCLYAVDPRNQRSTIPLRTMRRGADIECRDGAGALGKKERKDARGDASAEARCARCLSASAAAARCCYGAARKRVYALRDDVERKRRERAAAQCDMRVRA